MLHQLLFYVPSFSHLETHPHPTTTPTITEAAVRPLTHTSVAGDSWLHALAVDHL